MKSESMVKKIFIFLFIIALCVLAIIGYVYIYIKYNIGFPCSVNKLFGVYCPGCGLTRAGIAMLNFDFYQAFRYNAFALILLPVLAVFVIMIIWEYIFEKSSFISKIPIPFWIVLFACVFIYGIIRNFIPFLQPVEL